MNSSYHFEAHKSFIRGLDAATCHFDSELEEKNDACDYVTVTKACHEDRRQLINYANLIFCELSRYVEVTLPLAGVVLCLILLVYNIAICSLAYHCILNVVSLIKFLHVSEHNAGATILVLISGLPNVISIFFLYKNDTEVIFNSMLGTALFLRSIQVGLLVASYPVILHSTYFVRDSLAYLAGIMILCNIVIRNETSVFEGIFAMVLYPAVCLIVYVQHAAARDERLRATPAQLAAKSTYFRVTGEIQIMTYPVTSTEDPLTVGIWKQFLIVINPLRSEIYNNAAIWQKFLLIVGILFTILFKLLVPVVNLMLPGEGWSKLLLILNFLLSPFVILPLVDFQFSYFYPCLGVGIFMAIVSFFVFSVKTPKYQFFIALYALACQMFIGQTITSEIMSVMHALGNVCGIKRSVIGATFQSWAYAFPEIIYWCTLVRWNIKTLALIDFCMSPLLGMIFSIGLTIVLKSISQKAVVVSVRAGDLGFTSVWFSVCESIFFGLSVITTNYQLRKTHGVYLVLVYILFMIYVCLYEYEIIHAYGTDHIDDEKLHNAPWA